MPGFMAFSQSRPPVVAVAGILLTLVADATMSPVARAANDCGAGTTVTCTTAGNPYANGISYFNVGSPETVDFQSGVVVTPNSGITGVSLTGIGAGAQTVNAGTGVTIETTGNNAGGIRVDPAGDAISITSQSVITHGNTTLFAGAQAILALTSGTGAAGNITIDSSQGTGLLETFGTTSPGIQAASQGTGGTINITTGTVKTHGAGSTAVTASIAGGAGNLTIQANGDVTATGVGADSFGGFAGGIAATNNGTGKITITTKNVSTAADNGGGVTAQGNGGLITIDTTGGTVSTTGNAAGGVGTSNGSVGSPVMITTGNINTTGNLSSGISGLAKGPNNALTIHSTAGTIHTKGSNAPGINAVTGSFPFATNTGTLTIRSGDITTDGGSAAIVASANRGAINITASGAINSTGDGIQTTNAATAGTVTSTINVTGSINTSAASAHGISAQIITGGNNAITVGGSVTASAGTGVLSSGSGDSVTVNTGGSVSGVTGVQFTDTGTTSLTNSGTITGTGTNAILFSGSSADTFTNSGTVNGNVSLGGGNDLAILNTGSTITGTMNAGSGTDTLRLAGAGTGSLDLSKATNFEIGQKIDAGTWTLTGTGTISTSTTISGGVLSVNGQLTSPTVTVANGGTLGGTGTIIGNVTVNGNIAPGNSIGTLNVTGPFTQATGSTYTVELNTATSDLINVTGSATIQPGTAVSVFPAPGFYTLGHRYTILTASGGVTGQYTTLTDNAPFVAFQLNSDAHDIFLDVILSGLPFQQIAQTRNQIAAAGGLQSLGAGNPVFDAAIMLSAPAALHAFDLLSGEIHASVVTTLLDNSRFVRSAIIGRLRQDIGGVASIFAPNLTTQNITAADDDTVMAYARKPARAHDPIGAALAQKGQATPNDRVVTAWGQMFGNWGHVASDGNAAQLDRSTGGVISGIDTTFAGQRSDVWRFGLAGGYQQTSVGIDDRSSSGKIDAYHFAGYAGLQQGAIGVRVGTAYTWQDVATNRSIVFPGIFDTAHGSYGARTAQVFGEVGYGMSYRQIAFEPFADLAYVDVRTDAFTEAGGATTLAASGGTSDTTYSTLGLRAAAMLPWPTIAGDLTVKGSVGWQHAFGTIVPTATLAFASGSAPFTVAGLPIAKDAAAVELGLEAQLNRKATFNVAYTGQLAGATQDNGFTATFTQRF